MKVLSSLLVALAAVVAVVPAAGPPGRVMLRVLCYNIHHGRGTDDRVDLPRIAKVIREARPDVVALQEVDNKCRRSGRVDQTAELARLTRMHGQFGKQINFEGGEYGQAILSRTPIDKLKIHWLPGQPERERRIAVEARLTVAGVPVAVVSTHLHHRNAGIREQQAAKLNELFDTTDHPVILTGDLNASPDSKPLAILSKSWTVATTGPELLTFPAAKPRNQIDFVLFRPGKQLRVVESQVVPEPIASDHRPVLAVLELTP